METWFDLESDFDFIEIVQNVSCLQYYEDVYEKQKHYEVNGMKTLKLMAVHVILNVYSDV
jgi:hypothetical protein